MHRRRPGVPMICAASGISSPLQAVGIAAAVAALVMPPNNGRHAPGNLDISEQLNPPHRVHLQENAFLRSQGPTLWSTSCGTRTVAYVVQVERRTVTAVSSGVEPHARAPSPPHSSPRARSARTCRYRRTRLIHPRRARRAGRCPRVSPPCRRRAPDAPGRPSGGTAGARRRAAGARPDVGPMA